MTNSKTDDLFLDLEIRIFQKQDAGYPVEITAGGQQEFPRGYLAADIASWVPSGNPAADGCHLFEALLADPTLLKAWSETHGQAPQRRFRLRIDPAAAELHTLPWELLREDENVLSANAATPFSRYLPIALPWGGAVEERPIRVLVAIANPDDLESAYSLTQIDVALEQEALQGAFADIDAGQIEVKFLDPPVTLERLEEALREGYHILHYLGHGAFNKKREQAVLFMQNEEGHTQPVPDDALAQMLARQAIHPQLVFLGACQSATRATGDAFRGLGPKLVSVGVPAVVAMQDFVTVTTARKFSTVFYKQLLEHGQVDKAINEARSTLLTSDRPDAAVPVLFMRLKSGQLWGEEIDARGQILGTQNPRIFWSGMVRMIQSGKCTPIIGPRVHGRWLPTPEQVATQWAKLHDYPFLDREELARVSQYMASNQGDDFPRCEMLDTLMGAFTERLPEELRPKQQCATLTEMTRKVGWPALVADDPNETHQVLASLNLPLYLTTNFDNFMFEALAAQGKSPAREICRWNRDLEDLPSLFEEDPNYVPTPEAPLVYHLFGTDEEINSLVLTEDDYLDFLVKISAEMDRIPNYIRGAMANSALMFVGYSLYDWEFRVILRGLVTTMSQRRRFKHVAVQMEFDEAGNADQTAVQSFLQQYFQDAEINVFWGSAQQFIAELREEWKATNR